MRVELVIFDLRVALFGACDHLGGEIHADPVRWFEVRDQTSRAAANFKDALVWVNKEFVNVI